MIYCKADVKKRKELYKKLRRYAVNLEPRKLFLDPWGGFVKCYQQRGSPVVYSFGFVDETDSEVSTQEFISYIKLMLL